MSSEELRDLAECHGFDSFTNLDGTVSIWIPWTQRNPKTGKIMSGEDLVTIQDFEQLLDVLGY